MGGGAGPALLSPDDAPADEAPADDAQAPIDLVSDPSESDGSASDSDHSSDVAIVEPVDQAAAVVPGAADLLAASDFTPHLLNDMHAPMVTVILEEQALAPARVLARVPYLEHLLSLVQQGCEPAQLPAACAPALARAHADLATYLATLIVGLFDQARLAALPEALADYQKLGDPTVVARTLLAQINCTADVAANMLPHTYTTGSGIFRFAWRAPKLHDDRPQTTHGLHVSATADCVLLAQPTRGHEASHPVVSCLSCGCALPAALYSCSVEVRVPAHPSEPLRGVVHGSAPL